MTEKERMLKGMLYKGIGIDEELTLEHKRAMRLTRLYNATTEEQMDERVRLLKELFGSTGVNIYIEPPFRCDYGSNISIGENFYANYDCIILDIAPVAIGRNVFFAPRVSLFSASHPIDAEIRNEMLEYGKPITIGDDVWIGGNTVINPGVTIGNNVVIGSGSVVTNDIPEGTIAVGNPCRVLRSITEEDRIYWSKKREEYLNQI